MIEIQRRKQQIPVERTETAVNGPDALHGVSDQQSVARASNCLKMAFTGIDEKRDYRAMYRTAFAYHESHNPPTVDREYWRTHEPGVDECPKSEIDYWERAAQDMSAAAGGDPFLIGLLTAVYNELEREYRATQRAAQYRQGMTE